MTIRTEDTEDSAGETKYPEPKTEHLVLARVDIFCSET
ncbi:hypothetical protein MES4922_110204 [Mesorhizobium ventifaucium]|uniref:Uncharacterized protein n=1 Tax=Mesorhizobium ventifaucium TaxID=666020 RepID=A0ABM9DE29_9HYPH|nr:hypothetical protein MES4922_110204 [Mesorhizobium ventifaucium]